MKRICLVIFSFFLLLSIAHAQSFEWWNSSWHYRIPIEVNSTSYERENAVIEVKINFTAELENLSAAKPFDENSVRVVEYNSSGSVICEIPSQFDKDKNYNASTNAFGIITWIMNGTTPANQKRYYYIYFDTLENSKEQPNYTTNLTYSWDGEEFWLNNSLRAIKVDTLRGENTSGIYYATNYTTDLFYASPTEKTIEYVRLTNGSQDFMYDLRGNASFIAGPVKIIVIQEGNEALWNQPEEKTSEAKLIKKYIFYEKQPWIKIQIELRANASITRESSEITAIALDAERAFGIDALTGDIADPFSWYSAYSSQGKGLGIILANETYTTNFYASGSLAEGRIGLKLDSSALIQGESIFAEAYIYLNDEASHEPVEELRKRLMDPVKIIKQATEKREIVIEPKTDFSIYNRGETAIIMANITKDIYDLVAYVNATLNGTTLMLYDDGTHEDKVAGDKVYTNTYTFPTDAEIGKWNLTVKAYDSDWQLLVENSTTFNLTNLYFANLTILNPKGAIERVVYAELTLKNYRGDSEISGASLGCEFDSTTVNNITDDGEGNYLINFTAPSQIGSFNLTCNATKHGNYGFDSEIFYTEAKKTFLTIALEPEIIIAANITQNSSQLFNLNLTLKNTGNGTAYSTLIIFNLPLGWSVEPINASCGDLSANHTCTRYFNLTIPQGTPPGNYSIFSVANWTNPDSTLNSTEDFLNASVLSNPILKVEENFLKAEIQEGMTKNIGNFTINSAGNDVLQNITFDCFSGEICKNFTVEFLPSNISSLNAGSTANISVFVTVPEGYGQGNYTGKINISSANNGFDILELNITVPPSRTWNVTPITCEKTVLINETGFVCNITLSNTGNQPINFTIFPTSANFTFVNETNFTLEKQELKIITINYNTSSAEQKTYYATYTINATTPNSEPSNQTVRIILHVVFGPSVASLTEDFGRQLDIIIIKANVTDRSGATIDFVKVNITKPNNEIETLELTNVTPNLPGVSSLWVANYSPKLRGIYEISIFAQDKEGGFGEAIDSFKVFARLNITLKTGRKAYYAGESASIYYNITDGLGEPLKANVSLEVRNSRGNLILNYSSETNENGTLPIIQSFLIANDMPLGNYTLKAFTSFYDSKVNISLNQTTTYLFKIFERYEVEFETAVAWYPEEIMKFYILLYTQNSIIQPEDINLVVYDPAENIYLKANLSQFTLINQTNISLLYRYQYAMPSSTPAGYYLAILEISQDCLKIKKLKSFRVSTGGPYDVAIVKIEGEVSQGDNLDFELLIRNMGDVSQDVFLDYWISKDNKTYASVHGEAIFVEAGGNKTITRSLPIYSNQAPGEYFLNVRLSYSNIKLPIRTNRSFLVTAALPPAPTAKGAKPPAAQIVSAPITISPVFEVNVIKIIPEELLIERGGVRYIIIEVRNSGNQNLHEISVNVDKFKEWFKTIKEIEILEPEKTASLIGKFEIPYDTEKATYFVNLTVFSKEGTKKEEAYKLIVVESKKELLELRINKTKESLKKLENKVAELAAEGFDIEKGVKLLERAYDLISISERYTEEGRYLEATEMLEEARNLMEKASYELGISKKKEIKKISLFPIFLLIAITFLIFLLIFSGIFLKKFGFLKRKPKKEEIPWEIIETQYREGRISKRTYEELKKRFRK